jgi:uncharacterized protein YggL (DUF469 family)
MKLFLDEFEIKGLELQIFLQPGISLEASNCFWRDFVSNAIEAHSLTYGGLERGFVCPEHRATATEEHREILKRWLADRSEVVHFVVGELENANPWPRPLYPLLRPRQEQGVWQKIGCLKMSSRWEAT